MTYLDGPRATQQALRQVQLYGYKSSGTVGYTIRAVTDRYVARSFPRISCDPGA